jgi:hypothetical protein
MPLDAEPDPEGNVRVEWNKDRTPVAYVLRREELAGAQDGELYRPHWATCPDAEAWRK